MNFDTKQVHFVFGDRTFKVMYRRFLEWLQSYATPDGVLALHQSQKLAEGKLKITIGYGNELVIVLTDTVFSNWVVEFDTNMIADVDHFACLFNGLEINNHVKVEHQEIYAIARTMVIVSDMPDGKISLRGFAHRAPTIGSQTHIQNDPDARENFNTIVGPIVRADSIVYRDGVEHISSSPHYKEYLDFVTRGRKTLMDDIHKVFLPETPQTAKSYPAGTLREIMMKKEYSYKLFRSIPEGKHYFATQEGQENKMAFNFNDVRVCAGDAQATITADEFRRFILRFVHPTAWYEMYCVLAKTGGQCHWMYKDQSLKFVSTKEKHDQAVLYFGDLSMAKVAAQLHMLNINLQDIREYESSKSGAVFGTVLLETKIEDDPYGFKHVITVTDPHSNVLAFPDNVHQMLVELELNLVKELYIGVPNNLPSNNNYHNTLECEAEFAKEMDIPDSDLPHTVTEVELSVGCKISEIHGSEAIALAIDPDEISKTPFADLRILMSRVLNAE